MGILITILTVFLAIDCLLLVGIILLQRGRGQGLAGAFGVGSMEEALGAHAASTAQKITAALAVVFLVLSVVVGLLRRNYDSAAPRGHQPTPKTRESQQAPSPSGKAGAAAPAPGKTDPKPADKN